MKFFLDQVHVCMITLFISQLSNTSRPVSLAADQQLCSAHVRINNKVECLLSLFVCLFVCYR